MPNLSAHRAAPLKSTTLPRDPLAWVFAALLVLFSADLAAKTDRPVELVSVAFLAAVIYRRAHAYLPSALLIAFLFPLARFYPRLVWDVPVLGFLVPFLLCCACCVPFPVLRARFDWLRKGRLDQIVWFLVVLTSLVSALALILWALWTDYFGVATQMVAPLKAHRWLSLFVLVPGFAVANAAAEEAVYRGVLQDGLEAAWGDGSPWAVLVLQASAFAAAHYRSGFPNGNVGYGMVFIYALMLGWLKRRTGGILAPYVTHVAADAVIGVTLLLLDG